MIERARPPAPIKKPAMPDQPYQPCCRSIIEYDHDGTPRITGIMCSITARKERPPLRLRDELREFAKAFMSDIRRMRAERKARKANPTTGTDAAGTDDMNMPMFLSRLAPNGEQNGEHGQD